MKYVKPKLEFIGHSKETKRLYRLESQRNETIKECARELSKVMHLQESQFWTVAMPQALLDTLEEFDSEAATLAAQVYLAAHTDRTSS